MDGEWNGSTGPAKELAEPVDVTDGAGQFCATARGVMLGR